MDGQASVIQRHCRGFLVRCVLKSHTAAVTIHRRVIGMLTRKKLRQLHLAATDIQRLVRGGLARRHFQEVRSFKCRVAITIQTHIRVWIAKRISGKLAAEKRRRDLMLKATIDLQRMFRGWKGRQRAEHRRTEYMQAQCEYNAAMKLQTMVRSKQARRQVDQLRDLRLKDMEKAATFVRKVWLGSRMKKRYKALQAEFVDAVDKIITIQRYMRGCLCRLKMWREAVRTEEELWAVVEIQRCWRGYHGRVVWEMKYEHIWRREMGAAVMQRHVRGWLARVRVNRLKRKMARAEFERARERFRAAQRIQALTRGVLTRRLTNIRRARAVKAATDIQRIQRGRALRANLWNQVMEQKSTMITAVPADSSSATAGFT